MSECTFKPKTNLSDRNRVNTEVAKMGLEQYLETKLREQERKIKNYQA